MKIQLLVSVIVVSCGASIVAMDNVDSNHNLTFNMAKCGNDLAPFKDIYCEVYKNLKTIRSKSELEERFDSIKQLVGNEDFEVALFEKDKKLVGFMPFFRKTIQNRKSAVIYDTPVVPSEREPVFNLLLPVLFKLFNIQKGYCFFGSQASEEIRDVVKKLRFKEDFNARVEMDNVIKHNPEKYTVCSRDFTLY